jgi:hypothetical protein
MIISHPIVWENDTFQLTQPLRQIGHLHWQNATSHSVKKNTHSEFNFLTLLFFAIHYIRTTLIFRICIYLLFYTLVHVTTARPQVADGGDGLQMRVAANILKQSWRADKGRSSGLRIGGGAQNSQ